MFKLYCDICEIEYPVVLNAGFDYVPHKPHYCESCDKQVKIFTKSMQHAVATAIDNFKHELKANLSVNKFKDRLAFEEDLKLRPRTEAELKEYYREQNRISASDPERRREE